MFSMYVLMVLAVVLFYFWFAKEFTNATPRDLIRLDVPVMLTVATIVALFAF